MRPPPPSAVQVRPRRTASVVRGRRCDTRSMRGLAALVLAPFAALVFAYAVTTTLGGPPAVTATPPDSVVWANRVFTSKRQFARWLGRHDSTYPVWVALHPGASPWGPRPVAPTSVHASAKQAPVSRELATLFVVFAATF